MLPNEIDFLVDSERSYDLDGWLSGHSLVFSVDDGIYIQNDEDMFHIPEAFPNEGIFEIVDPETSAKLSLTEAQVSLIYELLHNDKTEKPQALQ